MHGCMDTWMHGHTGRWPGVHMRRPAPAIGERGLHGSLYVRMHANRTSAPTPAWPRPCTGRKGPPGPSRTAALVIKNATSWDTDSQSASSCMMRFTRATGKDCAARHGQQHAAEGMTPPPAAPGAHHAATPCGVRS